METTTNAAIRKAKEKAEDLIRDITRKEHISPAELEAVMKSVCLIMKVDGTENGNGDYEGEYSERGMSRNSSRRNEMYNYEPMGYDEASYRRGRSSVTGQYVSRDSGGGASSRGSYDSSHRYYDGGSRNSGYSGHSMRDRAIAKLEGMYDEAQTEHEKHFLDECIKMIEIYR